MHSYAVRHTDVSRVRDENLRESLELNNADLIFRTKLPPEGGGEVESLTWYSKDGNFDAERDRDRRPGRAPPSGPRRAGGARDPAYRLQEAASSPRRVGEQGVPRGCLLLRERRRRGSRLRRRGGRWR